MPNASPALGSSGALFRLAAHRYELWSTRAAFCEPSRVAGVPIAEVPETHLNDLEPLWRALHDHHSRVTPHLADRSLAFARAWESRWRMESRWLQSEPDSFVLAARAADRYVGYAFVRVRSGDGFAASWSVSDPLAELATLSVLPQFRGQGIGSALMDAVELRLREMGIADMAIKVIATNAEAIPFYERRGALPFDIQFIQRVEPEP
jgi:ribosomal protein S18 acetylase RimI-like enzyme